MTATNNDKQDSVSKLDDFITDAWGLIANAYGGDWEKATPDWKGAAERWREKFLDYCGNKTRENTETWYCDVCKRERPDKYISVVTYPVRNLPNAQRNLKYCNDKPLCYERANERAFAGEM